MKSVLLTNVFQAPFLVAAKLGFSVLLAVVEGQKKQKMLYFQSLF